MAVRDTPAPTENYGDARAATREKTDRYPADVLLRDQGFAIHSRPKTGPAVWVRGGRFYDHDEAVQLAVRLRNRALKELEAKSSVLP